MRYQLSRLFYSLLLAIALTGCQTLSSNKSEDASSTITQGAKIRYELARAYYQAGEFETALTEIKQVTNEAPSMDSHHLKALIEMELVRFKEAEYDFNQAIKLDPNNPDLQNNYAWFLCKTNRIEAAMNYFEKALQNINYRSPEKALNNAAYCSMLRKDLNTAQNYLKRVNDIAPEKTNTYFNFAKLYYLQQKWTQASFYSRQLIKRPDVNAEGLWLAIKIEHNLGETLNEETLAHQLQKRFPDSVEYRTYQRKAFSE